MKLVRVLAIVVIVCVVLPAGVVSGYRWTYPAYIVRYRLTVNAFDGARPCSGSSVGEMRVITQPRVLDSPPWTFRVNGEATFVDLGAGRNLVGLLAPGPSEGTDAIGILFKAFRIPFTVDHAADLKSLKGERQVAVADWPPFVTFRDVKDPLSGEPADPKALEGTFGSGVHIENVTLEITDAAVTHTLIEKLPWLATRIGHETVLELAKRHFSTRAFIRSDQ